MTIRPIPEAPTATLAVRQRLRFEVSPTALARWDADLRAATDETANNVISILDVIGEDFFGNGITVKRISAALRSIGNQDVVVHLNSPGGDYFEGLAIYNRLREHKQQITVKVLGVAASAASVIAMAGDHIEMPKAGFMMIHNTWAMAIGDRNDLRDFADFLEPFDRAAAQIYADRSGLDGKEVGKMMDKETWFNGTDALDKGLADALLPADQVEKAKNAADTSINAERRIDVLLAKAGVPRQERRRLINEFQKSGTQDAAEGDTQDAVADARRRSGFAAMFGL